MKSLHVTNTLSRKKELFEPIKPGFVGMYVCGPTVYGPPHLGHAKSYLAFDIIARYLRYLGHNLRYIQNITDVGHLTDDADDGEDKLLKQSRLERRDPMEIAERYTFEFFRDMDALGLLRPDISPRASGHIPEQIAMIERLIKNGNAYEINGNVYFDVASDPEYGKLSGRKVDEAESGTRVESAIDKKNPTDFALWKRADESHLMKWNSPWGEGYPGWHIECSAMSTKYLGETFDIHGGGIENQFPHHECEIAQSESAHGKPFVKYWLHNNMVTLNGKKMGKSLGNAISLQQFFTGDHPLLTRAWSPAVIRFFLLQSHYRSTTDFSEPALEAAESGLKNLHRLIGEVVGEGTQYSVLRTPDDGKGASQDTSSSTSSSPFTIHHSPVPLPPSQLSAGFESCLNDDFNTATAIAYLFEKLRELRQAGSGAVTPDVAEFLYRALHDVLGIWPDADAGAAGNAYREKLDGAMELILEIRANARKNKDWSTADLIRDKLNAAGISVEDGKDGKTVWKV